MYGTVRHLIELSAPIFDRERPALAKSRYEIVGADGHRTPPPPDATVPIAYRNLFGSRSLVHEYYGRWR